MGSAKWLIFILLTFTITSALVGVADMAYLGSYAQHSPMFPVFKVFGATSSTEAGTSMTFSWTDIKSVGGLFVGALMWNYSVLIHNPFGNFVRWVILIPLSAALLFSFGLMLWSHVPIIGRGSQ